MKKILVVFLILLILNITGCVSSQPNYLEYDTFFKTEKLIEYHLDNLPKPSLKDSVLYNNNGNTLYMNLTQDEFDDYLKEIANYILSKEDVYNKGLYYTNDLLSGPLFLPLDIDVYIPLEDNQNYSKSGNAFAFSLEEELYDGWMPNSMVEAFKVEVKFLPGVLDDINFKYTSYIEIGPIKYAQYDYCIKEHKYGEVKSYPVPNTDIVIDISNCIYCGEKKQSEYYGNNISTYSKEVVKGYKYLDSDCYRQYLENPTGFAGLIEHLKLRKVENEQYQVLVNGFEIPLIYEEDYFIIYGFIMPMSDVEIEILISENN